MPIYEYTCNKCSTEFEELVRSPKQRIKCPSCGGARTTRKFSVFGMKSSGGFTPSKGGGAQCSSCSSHSCNHCG